MIYLPIAILIGAAAPAPNNPEKLGIAIAKRLVAAIDGQSDYQDADFAKPLGKDDKAALRQFGECKVTNIDYMENALNPRARYPTVFVRDFNNVSVLFGCKGVSWDTPVGISLHLQDGKIATIETHNADLMRTK